MNTAEEILALADELTEPHVHIERVPIWDRNRNRKFREHRSTIPGLLQQLYDAAVDPVGKAGEVVSHAKLQSRPPLAVATLSMYFEVCAGVQARVVGLGIDPRPTPESNIRAVVGMVGRLPDEVLTAILTELRTWRRWCAVMTGWQSSTTFRPRVHCPSCLAWHKVVVSTEKAMAVCSKCTCSWEGSDLQDLADKVKSVA